MAQACADDPGHLRATRARAAPYHGGKVARPRCGGLDLLDRRGHGTDFLLRGVQTGCQHLRRRRCGHGPAGNGAAVPGTHIAPETVEGLLLRAFDPYPYDPADAREEMRASAYDRTGDGVCDAQVCRNVRALVPEFAVLPLQAEAVRADLAEIGIELELETRPWPEPFVSLINDPREQIPVVTGSPWFMDYPEGIGWFLGLFDISGLDGCCNASLVGASPEKLRKWGYEVRSVPSVDDRLEACQQRRGIARTQCWAELDQYLMTEVVPRVPYMYMEYAQAVSERVVEYSFDAASRLPALDGIALAPDSG